MTAWARADSDRAAAMLDSSAHQSNTPQMLQEFARTARERIRIDGGAYRRYHLPAQNGERAGSCR
jgi:site-specific DNA recombinase